MSRAFCLVCGAHEVRSPPQVFTRNISYSIVYVSTLMAILIMGKYDISKSSIILYHKTTSLSIGFTKLLEFFPKSLASAVICTRLLVY